MPYCVVTVMRTGSFATSTAYPALSRSDRAYVLETGNIVKTGTGTELLDDPSVREAYLGVA